MTEKGWDFGYTEKGWDFGYLEYGPRKNQAKYQVCVNCDETTGRCNEDAIMYLDGGPYCEDCFRVVASAEARDAG